MSVLVLLATHSGDVVELLCYLFAVKGIQAVSIITMGLAKVCCGTLADGLESLSAAQSRLVGRLYGPGSVRGDVS